jgi:hypothetical protein
MNIVEHIVSSEPPKKRGRKSNKELEEIQREKENTGSEEKKDLKIRNTSSEESSQSSVSHIPKKRGRKPKGGKIIQQPHHIPMMKELKPNVILHLKCFMKDLKRSDWDGVVGSFYFLKNDSYEIVSNTDNITLIQNNTLLDKKEYVVSDEEVPETIIYDEVNKTDIHKKLKILQYDFHKNIHTDNKSACFWCTYTFENPSIYIPTSHTQGKYNVYGCFCSPECGVSYLMNQNIDTSVKFERYALLNSMYSKIYNYTESIHPAPNPHYLLEKFYGNLTIQEYRASFNKERLFLVLDKPITHFLPEVIEDKETLNIHNITIQNKKINIKEIQGTGTGIELGSAVEPSKKKNPFF